MKKIILIALILCLILLVGCQPGGEASARLEQCNMQVNQQKATILNLQNQINDLTSRAINEQSAADLGGEIGIWKFIEDPPGSGNWKWVNELETKYIPLPGFVPGQVISVIVTPDFIKALTAGTMTMEQSVDMSTISSINTANIQTNGLQHAPKLCQAGWVFEPDRWYWVMICTHSEPSFAESSRALTETFQASTIGNKFKKAELDWNPIQ